ncbi:MAG: isoprenyl transferase [Clostridiales bacterium]|nr:isoprenyl transferase [Clostridiales bacterium]
MTGTTIDRNRLPRHIGIIMDGNGRWAKRHRLQVARGHNAGVEAMRNIIRDANDLGLEVLSLYAFSTENWRRSKTEVDALMALLIKYFKQDIDELREKNVRVLILGDKDGMPGPQRDALYDAEERTKDCTGLALCLAINYGGRAELVRAAKLLAAEAQAGQLSPAAIDEAALSGRLYTEGLPDVDLLIRTSGELRLSNFLLWQSAYAEFAFPYKLWPDFTVKDFHDCIAAYQRRSRRFGGRI